MRTGKGIGGVYLNVIPTAQTRYATVAARESHSHAVSVPSQIFTKLEGPLVVGLGGDLLSSDMLFFLLFFFVSVVAGGVDLLSLSLEPLSIATVFVAEKPKQPSSKQERDNTIVR